MFTFSKRFHLYSTQPSALSMLQNYYEFSGPVDSLNFCGYELCYVTFPVRSGTSVVRAMSSFSGPVFRKLARVGQCQEHKVS